MLLLSLLFALLVTHGSQASEQGKGYTVLNDPLVKTIQDASVGRMSPPEVKLDTGCIITREFIKVRERIRNFQVKPDDIWICTFPKSGTTWTQEMIWLLRNNIDIEEAKQKPLHERTVFLEYKSLYPENYEIQEIPDTITEAENMPSPRIIKTHLPISELPEAIFNGESKPKVIYVHRNPRDVAVSYFHHFVFWNNYKGSENDFWKAFVKDEIIYCPYWDHVIGFWNKKKDANNNIFMTSFEEMKTDLRGVLDKTARFLGVSYTPDQITALLNHLSFDSMRNNRMTNFEDDYKAAGLQSSTFMRKGEVGTGNTEMPENIRKMFDDWTSENHKRTDFPFYKNNND